MLEQSQQPLMEGKFQDKVHTYAKAKLQWQCRRGMLELDILLGIFLQNDYDTLTLEEKHCFMNLLAHPDQHLYRLLLNPKLSLNKDERQLLERISAHSKQPEIRV